MAKAKPVWDRPAIIAEIHRREQTLTGLARDAGVYETACRLGISGRSRIGAQIIADFLGVAFEELFPGMYPRGRGRPRDNNRNGSSSTSSKQRVAADSRRGVA